MKLSQKNNTNITDKIDQWCEVLEQKAKNQTYGSQQIFFWFSTGKKYYKIVQSDNYTKNDSVHAFVNKITGDIYKPASWNAPYKDARYNILSEYDQLLDDCDWAGEYLYKR